MKSNKQQPSFNLKRICTLCIVIYMALVILLCVSWLWQADMGSQQLDYSQVRQLFLQEKVEQVGVNRQQGACRTCR